MRCGTCHIPRSRTRTPTSCHPLSTSSRPASNRTTCCRMAVWGRRRVSGMARLVPCPTTTLPPPPTTAPPTTGSGLDDQSHADDNASADHHRASDRASLRRRRPGHHLCRTEVAHHAAACADYGRGRSPPRPRRQRSANTRVRRRPPVHPGITSQGGGDGFGPGRPAGLRAAVKTGGTGLEHSRPGGAVGAAGPGHPYRPGTTPQSAPSRTGRAGSAGAAHGPKTAGRAEVAAQLETWRRARTPPSGN